MLRNRHMIFFGLLLSASTHVMSVCNVTSSDGETVRSGYGIAWEYACKKDFEITRPTLEETGKWIRLERELLARNEMTTPFDQRIVTPQCFPSGVKNFWFITPEVKRDHSFPECTVRAGDTVIFSAFSQLILSGRSGCENEAQKVRDEIDKHKSHFSVSVNEMVLPPGAFWRNGSLQCFPLETPLSGLSVQRNGGDDERMTYAYTDGFWASLVFNSPGVYLLRLTKPPHLRWNWEDTYFLDSTFKIHVTAK